MANEPVNTNETNETTPVDTSELEARIKALESENNKLRQANTNASAEASKFKKQLQEKQTEEERRAAEEAERNAARDKELEELRAERNIANYVSALVAPDIGMDAENAKAVAEALNTGEIAKVFDGIRKFVTAHDKALREDALKNNPTLPGGASPKRMTQGEFDNMSYTEMLKFKVEHPEEYEEYAKN